MHGLFGPHGGLDLQGPGARTLGPGAALIRFERANFLISAAALALAVGAVASCESVGNIGDSRTPGTGSGAAGTTFSRPPDPPDPSGEAGVPASGGGTGVAGNGTGVAGTTGGGTGVAGTTGGGTGVAGTTGGGTGVAGTTGNGTGAAGAGSGAAGTSGAAGRPGTAGTSGAAGMVGAAGAGAAGASGLSRQFCKRGLAYQANSLGDLQAISKGASWWYNWSTQPEKSAAGWEATGIEFVPMVWGQKGGPPDPATIEKQIPAGARYILGFNEPNRGDQANITAAQAAALWPRIMQIAKDRNLLIGSPSPQYCAGDCNDTDPFHWLDAFFAACTGCKVDFMATHWYACTADALKSHLSKFKKYGKPVWVTEFSCMDAGDHSAAGEATYMKTAVDILEKDPTVFRYSWFTGRWPDPSGISLFGSASGALTDLGNTYLTLPATNVCGP
jgi:hypothetical protein